MATVLAMTILVSALSACTSGGDKVKIDARFLNMNQANFYVYSPDGVMDGIDTIRVNGGRFTYERPVMQQGTLVLVFPNYAVMPVFVEPGADISIDANAAHLKSMEITGTEDNEVFTQWRQNSDKLSPAEMVAHAERFVRDNPTSPVSLWLIRQYFVLSQRPDIRKAQALLEVMRKAMPQERRSEGVGLLLSRMTTDLGRLQVLNIGDALPRFTAKDIDGNPVVNGPLLKGNTVVCVWASWSYESVSILRQLSSNQLYSADSAKIDNILTICIDPSLQECRNTLKYNGAERLTTICDTMMWDSPLLRTLGVTGVPYNLKLKDGKVTGRCLPARELLEV